MNLTESIFQLMEKVSRKLHQLAARKNSVITVVAVLDIQIIADEVRMEQLLTNGKNALQFTENGHGYFVEGNQQSYRLETTELGLKRMISPFV